MWKGLLILITTFCLNVSSAFADMVFELDLLENGNTVTADMVLFGDFEITRDMVDPETHAITIINYGQIYGSSIEVCEGCNLIIRNSGAGEITDTEIVLKDGATLTQLILEDSDITAPDFGGTPFNILVHDATDLSLDNIVDIAGDADYIKLVGGSFTITDVAAVRGADIVLSGTIKIHLASIANLTDMVLFENASGTGAIYVYADDLGPLFVLRAYVDETSDNVMLERIRITDYVQIMGDVRGDFLNDLREYDPSDKLLAKMDAATSMEELESIMARSVRLNPINLMRPVRMLNLAVENAAVFDGIRSGIFAAPLYLMGGELDLVGMRGGVHGRITDRFAISLTGYGAMADYSDDINDFSAGIYGGNFAADYDMGLVFMRGLVGVSIASFEVGPVFDGRGVHFNPHGRSAYGAADVGHRFRFGNQFYASPFIGVGFDKEDVLHQSRDVFFARAGFDTGISVDSGDLQYNYSLRVFATGAETAALDLRMSAWSPIDAAGGHVSVGVVRYEDLRAYSFSVGAKFNF